MVAVVKILLVENETCLTETFGRWLEEFGYTVAAVAVSGDDAILKAGEITPHLVLMDTQLSGGMDGVEAAIYINNLYNIPVIYFSDLPDARMVERVKLSRPHGFLIKPVKKRELQIAIEIALLRHLEDEEREQMLQDLKRSLAKAKELKGLLPICASCKKVRDGQGSWKEIEVYIASHSSADFSHSICPQCMKALYPDNIKE